MSYRAIYLNRDLDPHPPADDPPPEVRKALIIVTAHIDATAARWDAEEQRVKAVADERLTEDVAMADFAARERQDRAEERWALVVCVGVWALWVGFVVGWWLRGAIR